MAAATATVTSDKGPNVLMTAKLAQLGWSTHSLSEKILYRKLLTIEPGRGNQFLGSVIDAAATAIPHETLKTFTTTLDNLLSAMTRRPELFLADTELEAHKTAILEYIDNPESAIDYTVEPYRSVTAMAEGIIRVMTIVNATCDTIDIFSCNSNFVMWLCCAALSSAPTINMSRGIDYSQYQPTHDYRADIQPVLAASDAIAMIPVIFEHRLTGHPTAMCMLSELINSPYPPQKSAKWLRHYFSSQIGSAHSAAGEGTHRREYDDYACEPELLARARASYKRYHPIDMSRRGDLCTFIAEMGLHSRKETMTSDTSQQTDYANWWSNFYVSYGIQSAYRHPDIDRLCVSWHQLDQTVELVSEGVRHWWQLWQHATDHAFPPALLALIHHRAVEWVVPHTFSDIAPAAPTHTATLTAWHQRGVQWVIPALRPHTLGDIVAVPPTDTVTLSAWHQRGVERVIPASRPYTLSDTIAVAPTDTAKLSVWHQQWLESRNNGVTTKLLYRQSRVKVAVELNYRETMINLSTCIARTHLSPAGVMIAINTITNKYLEGINVPGTTAVESGVAVAAPVFQMALSGFHHAGSAKSNTVILKRIEESMYATKTESMNNPSMYLVPAGQLSYHQACYARARLITTMLNDYVVRKQRMPVTDPQSAWLRLHLDITKMVQHRTSPYHIATQLSRQLQSVATMLSPSALHDGYLDITYTSDSLRMASIELETVIIDQILAVVIKGTAERGDSVVTGVFPLAVDVWARSVMSIEHGTINGITGSIIQLNEMEMNHRGIGPKRIQRILADTLGIDSWMLPYYDVGGYQLITDPRAPVQLDGVPPPGFGWYLFAIHDYGAIPDLKKAILKVKDDNRKLEDDYEKYWREKEELYIRPETKVSLALREWHLETNGTSLLNALNDPLVNPLYSYSSSVHEVNQVLGIAAAGMLQLRAYIELIKFSDNQLDWGHLLVIVNYQIAPGEPIPLSHTGYNKSDFNSMTLAGNSYATDNIIQTAASGQSEPVKGFVPEVMMGRKVSAGTGMFDVVMTPQQHTRMKIRIQALKGITRSKHAHVAESEVEFNDVITEQDNDQDQEDPDVERDLDEYDDALTKRSGNSIIQNDEQIMRFKGVRAIVAGEFLDEEETAPKRISVMEFTQKLTKPQEKRNIFADRSRSQNIDWGNKW